MSLKKVERVPFDLPLVDKPDERSRIVKIYASKIQQLSSLEAIEKLCDQLYENVYSKGLGDMDKMHALIKK